MWTRSILGSPTLGLMLVGLMLLPGLVAAQQAGDRDPATQDEGVADTRDDSEVDQRADDADDGDADDKSAERSDSKPLDLNLSGAEVSVQVVGGSVVIRGIEGDLDIFEELMDRLDGDYQPQGYRVIKLQSKNAQNIAQVVQQAAMKMQRPSPRPDEEISVQTIASNILLITGPEAVLDEVERMVAQLDDVDAGLPDFDSVTYELKHIKAIEAAPKLEELVNALRQRQGEDPASKITITPLDASNALFVIAPETEHGKIQELINRLDVEPMKGFGDLTLVHFPLINSKAQGMVDVLDSLLKTAGSSDVLTETIRRLRMIKASPDGTQVELPPLNLERQIKLIADDESQAIICATAEENIEPLGELIKLLDSVPLAEEQSIRVYPLVHADAVGTKELLDGMFESGKDLPKPAPGNETTEAVPTNPVGRSLVYNISISADARTNTLVVAGRTEQLVLVDGLLQKLDVPMSEIKYPLRLITLTNTDATRVGKIVEDLWEKRIENMQPMELGEAALAREKVFLSIDIRSNSMIISATQENFDEIKTMAATLDGAPERFSDQIRILTCTVASAGDLKTKIDELWQRKAELRGEADIPQDTPVVVADQRSNSLVIASGPDDFQEIKRLVTQLESQPLAPIAEIRLIDLENNDATQIGDMLQTLFDERVQQRLAQGQTENPSDRVAIATEPVTNTILVASSRDNYNEMLKLIEKLDAELDPEGIIRVFVLQNAQAENVATKIDELFEEGLYLGAVGSENEIVAQRQKVSLVADSRSNAVIASASKTNLSIIEKLILQMDTDRAPLVNADTRIFKLKNADPIKLAGMMDTLFEGMASNSEGDFKAPTIVPDAMSGTLIMTGSRDAIKRSTDMLASLDVPASAKSAIQVYQLRQASAVKLTTKITNIFEGRAQGADAERTPIFLMADEATNSIVCSASPEDHLTVAHLLSLLDVRSSISRQVQIFPLKQAKAEPTATSLEELFASQAEGGDGRADVIAIQADPRTNSLIVWAAGSEMANIADIIKKMDTSIPGPEMMLKVITLRHALATELAETLISTIYGGGQAGGDDEQAVILKFLSTSADGREQIRTLMRQDITIEPDERTNSLFVMAPAASMDMLENMIQSIDRIPQVLNEIRLFPLANADAEEVVDVLTSLFEDDTQGDGPETRLEVGGATPAASGASGEATAPGQKLRFTANRRTNSVIATGAAVDLDMIEDLIRQLDGQDVDERIRHVYEARYLPATDIATALSEYFDKENELLGDLDDETAILRRAERNVTVVSDEDSNTVLIGVSPRYYQRTMEMLYAIDRPPPQVVVQVMIAEVALNDSLDFGMEFALQDLAFSKNATVGPNGTVRGGNFDLVGGTDVGAAGAGSFGGFTFAITGADFNFLIRALQSDGSLEVLSAPTIVVSNNQTGNITIGDNVPFVQGSQVTNNGQVNSQVQYEDVGIIVDVTPHINPDGYVNMEIKPEISALNTGSSVQISAGVTAPIFTTRSAETTVTVKDGETIVIGGLIQTQEDERETKVPILGDLPGIGNLFRATSSTRRRTELLILLTVNVVRDEVDAREQSRRLRDQSGFMPKRVLRNPLMQGLRILPPDETSFEESPLREIESPSNMQQGVPIDRRPAKPPVYGPKPDTYGPARPVSPIGSRKTASSIYGPPRSALPASYTPVRPSFAVTSTDDALQGSEVVSMQAMTPAPASSPHMRSDHSDAGPMSQISTHRSTTTQQSARRGRVSPMRTPSSSDQRNSDEPLVLEMVEVR
ncbi:MAG: hypothetical protein GXP29_05430 [Planctomycetes bacterium]|nr:hypothetical protein [Planctomycetota bacterium]